MAQRADDWVRLRRSRVSAEHQPAAWADLPVVVWLDILDRYPDTAKWVAHPKPPWSRCDTADYLSLRTRGVLAPSRGPASSSSLPGATRVRSRMQQPEKDSECQSAGHRVAKVAASPDEDPGQDPRRRRKYTHRQGIPAAIDKVVAKGHGALVPIRQATSSKRTGANL